VSEVQITEEKKPICPHCGAEAKCRGDDVGGMSADSVQDQFWIWCDNCGYIASQASPGGSMSMGSHLNACPYCGAEESSHGQALPDEISKLAKHAIGIVREGDPAKKKSA
jgi:tRNA(Ile2) C34 agmatinyltransferase TiaS